MTKQQQQDLPGPFTQNQSMQAVTHLEAVVNHIQNLPLKERRNMYACLREVTADTTADSAGVCDVASANAFLPRIGVTVGEIGFAYVVGKK